MPYRCADAMRRVRWLSLGAGSYVQVGYPLLVFGLASVMPRSRTTTQTILPSVTVLIAAWNEESVIETKVRNTLESDYPPGLLQIVVATDGSTDETSSRVLAFDDSRIALSHSPERAGKIAAINRALEQV